MNLFDTVVTAILTSSTVSAVLLFFLKTYFKASITHQFNIAMERLKTELKIASDTAHEITERRLKTYPKLGELIYRVRNLAREFVTAGTLSSALRSELESRTRELEEKLYESRVDLERDGIFGSVHAYKNLARDFVRLLADLRFHQKEKHEAEAQDVIDKMAVVYRQLDVAYASAVERLSSLGGIARTASADS